jgi:hypothetical protein
MRFRPSEIKEMEKLDVREFFKYYKIFENKVERRLEQLKTQNNGNKG